MKLSIAALTLLAGAVSATPIATELLSLEGGINTRYSSDITRNIFCKGIHSHNDYWRDVPLYTALSLGVLSVEADVWHYDDDDTIYVGHHTAALNAQRTFQNLYLDPLMDILTQNNPNNTFTVNQTSPNGVWDTDSTQTLYLFVDLKTDGDATWPYIVEALEPLNEKGYLTTYNGTDVTYGPITVIGTGNTPYDYVVEHTDRYYFYDGPIATLNSSYPATVNPIASGSLSQIVGDIAPSGLNKTQYATVKKLIDDAHDAGIMTRFWEVAWWPVSTRNTLYRQLIGLGTDLLNADDLELASTFY
ncbi:hypothetical protein BZA70DRAFT_288286 [Myxozyma melibiosi]|uniref:Altered inheritance of mitochondria protein 6 n=1 Tax=Myxozyma melibiosi TaxID=54550 RepID=A0ABR1FCF3_9ASCO